MLTILWIVRRIVSGVLAPYPKSYPKRSLMSRAALIMRSLRIMFYLPKHKKLVRLDVFRHHLAAEWNTSLFHHLSQRHYLIKGLSARKRIDYLFVHYWFEEHAFDQRYKTRI